MCLFVVTVIDFSLVALTVLVAVCDWSNWLR